MSTELLQRKAELRKAIRARLGMFGQAERTAAAEEICRRLREQAVWHKANTILFFAPMADEPDIWPLLLEALKQGKTVALPRFAPDSGSYHARLVRDAAKDVVSGHYGIREPDSSCPLISLNKLDLVLVPGIGYDVHGHRLGRGKGYYDRLLANTGGLTCGVAFDAQLVAEIPTGPHDVRLNCILTPTRWIET